MPSNANDIRPALRILVTAVLTADLVRAGGGGQLASRRAIAFALAHAVGRHEPWRISIKYQRLLNINCGCGTLLGRYYLIWIRSSVLVTVACTGAIRLSYRKLYCFTVDVNVFHGRTAHVCLRVLLARSEPRPRVECLRGSIVGIVRGECDILVVGC